MYFSIAPCDMTYTKKGMAFPQYHLKRIFTMDGNF